MSHAEFPKEMNGEAREIIFGTTDLQFAILATVLIILFASVFFINSLSLTVLEKVLTAFLVILFLGAVFFLAEKYVYDCKEKKLANLVKGKGVVCSLKG